MLQTGPGRHGEVPGQEVRPPEAHLPQAGAVHFSTVAARGAYDWAVILTKSIEWVQAVPPSSPVRILIWT